MSTQPESSVKKLDRVFALIIISVSSFISAFSGSAFTLAAPSMAAELSINDANLSWIMTIYILATAMLQIPFGKIADNHGRKKIYFIGMLIFSSSALVLGFMDTTNGIMIMRFVQGIGGALIFATGTAILTSVFPPEKKGFAFGINIGSVYLGLTAGPSLGGFITDSLGWRWIFFIVVPIGAVLAILVMTLLKGEWKSKKKEKFDWIGTILYMSTLFMLLYGFRSIPDLYSYILIGCSIVTLIVFIWWEWRIDYPILQFRLFQKNRFFTFANLAAFTYYTASAATTFLLSLFLQNIQGYSASIAGLILLARPGIQAILSPIGGTLSDVIDHRIITTLGISIGTIGLVLLIFLEVNSPLVLIIMSLLCGGIGFGLFSSPNANSIMSSVPRETYGVASALVGTMRTIGQTMSIGIVTLLFTIILGDSTPGAPNYSEQFLKSTKIAFIIFSSIAFISLIISFMRGKNNFYPQEKIEEIELLETRK
ncbi:MAG: MFS transporter [Candidatus Heimdallarchaeaceae archaeon]